MTTSSTDRRLVQTTRTAFAILETLRERNGARISEVADELGLANSTVHRHLTTLVHLEWVAKEGDSYYIGLRFLELGEHARARPNGYQLAAEKVEELAAETDERAQFISEEHGWGVYVHRAIGRHAVQTDPGIGKRVPLHAISAGKAILAHLPERTIEQILELRGLPALTPNTITSRETLFDELEVIREQGYSTNDEENIPGLRAVSAPVIGKDGRVIGALSVSGPTHRLKGTLFEQDFPDLLLGTTNELELNIAYI